MGGRPGLRDGDGGPGVAGEVRIVSAGNLSEAANGRAQARLGIDSSLHGVQDGRGMKGVELYRQVRQAVRIEGLSRQLDLAALLLALGEQAVPRRRLRNATSRPYGHLQAPDSRLLRKYSSRNHSVLRC